VLLVISIMVPAPIQRPITQTAFDVHDARAPWFFLWVQQLLKYGDPFVLGVGLPSVMLVLLAILPYVLPQAGDHEFGRWLPRGNRIAQITLILIGLIVLVLTLLSVLPTAQL
jgi:quinol-cytochrome oxidoreductase complex cytochrome b subunit